MKKLLPWILLIAVGWLSFQLPKGQCPLQLALTKKEPCPVKEEKKSAVLSEGLQLLRNRRDKQAYDVFEGVLVTQPDNIDALWGKAEVLRRGRLYRESGELLNSILKSAPRHAPSLISLSYIKYTQERLDEAQSLLKLVLNGSCFREDEALANLMLGTINSRRSEKGGFFSKVKYGTQIRCYFLKAKALAPELPEVCLGLGTFYLLAPRILGGDLDKAINELEAAVHIAPDFATANARLAQAYKKKGLADKYNFYMNRARELDPENELLK